jgi:hypothetical protein
MIYEGPSDNVRHWYLRRFYRKAEVTNNYKYGIDLYNLRRVTRVTIGFKDKKTGEFHLVMGTIECGVFTDGLQIRKIDDNMVDDLEFYRSGIGGNNVGSNPKLYTIDLSDNGKFINRYTPLNSIIIDIDSVMGGVSRKDIDVIAEIDTMQSAFMRDKKLWF